MRLLSLAIVFMFFINLTHAQGFFIIHTHSQDQQPQGIQDSIKIDIKKFQNFLDEALAKKEKINGSAGFSFSGNVNDDRDLFNIGVRGSMGAEAYPYDLDFSFRVQATVQNGVFQESFSDIDISFDFNPIQPSPTDSRNGLWVENYVFIKRFTNNFLGIDQRYDTGAGFIFNYYSKKKLIGEGRRKDIEFKEKIKPDLSTAELEEWTLPPHVLDSIIERKIERKVVKENDSISQFLDSYARFHRSNIIKYSKLRLALLVGVYYELEKAFAENTISFNGNDTIIRSDFDGTSNLRWEIRPTIVWQPKDRYKLRVYPYIKMPFGNGQSVVRNGDLSDSRYDYFLDLRTSLEIKVEGNFGIELYYRRLYDNAPKRIFLEQDDGTFALLVGQRNNSQFGISFNFGF